MAALGAVLGVALLIGAPVASAGSPRDRVTGGGQTLVGTTGAGNTIAFTAQNTGDGDAARGEIQYVDRSGGTGQLQQKFHGNVLCLQVSGNMAKLAGQWERYDGSVGTFEFLVTDNGQGSAAANDTILLQREDTTPQCGEDDDDDDDAQVDLARGNVQVYDAP
jgi:hypothetical protein